MIFLPLKRRIHKMAHQYTIDTPHGDVHLTTEHHHSIFDSMEDFLRHHKSTIDIALGLVSTGVTAYGVYLQHGRRGPKLK
jgi:hypothetical protein